LALFHLRNLQALFYSAERPKRWAMLGIDLFISVSTRLRGRFAFFFG
jgi:hypothetical protein